MAMKRSRELIMTGLFLSKFGELPPPGKGSHRPPAELGVDSWGRAYAMFYRHLGGGHTLSVFANRLKNARDSFDGHVDSGRVGWRARPRPSDDQGPNRPPQRLSEDEQQVFDFWSPRTREEFWREVSRFCDGAIRLVEESILSDLSAELDPESTEIHKRTKGGAKGCGFGSN
jgi:hypothetical protein